jgi:hypothetical protein
MLGCDERQVNEEGHLAGQGRGRDDHSLIDDCVSLLREPDAANPHVRFDERGRETEAWLD